MKIDAKKNYIICGDNEQWLQDLPDESIDLCYIDPPFFSNRNYEIIWGNGFELRAFGDRFAGGISHYIDWMTPKIKLIHQKLKKTGQRYFTATTTQHIGSDVCSMTYLVKQIL